MLSQLVGSGYNNVSYDSNEAIWKSITIKSTNNILVTSFDSFFTFE